MPSGDGISSMRQQRAQRSVPESRHPRSGARLGAGADAGSGESAGDAVDAGARSDLDAGAGADTGTATATTAAEAAAEPRSQAPAGKHSTDPGGEPPVDNEAARRVQNLALGWAAAVRKADRKATDLAAELDAARKAGMPERVIAAYLAEAEWRSGGHPPPVR